MQQPGNQIVVDSEGLRGVIEPAPEAEFMDGKPDSREFATGKTTQLWIRLESGQRIRVPSEMLVTQENNQLYFPGSLAALENQQISGVQSTRDGSIIIPAIAETVQVEKQTVETGKVILTKRVHEREETVDLPLLHEEVEVNHVAVNRVVDEPPSIRYEADTMIVPVLEEVLVVEKRLMLKEEIYITKRRTEVHSSETVTLRHEDIQVERTSAGPANR
jgi:uncharacterized protein (TIGR02271 family)